MSKPATSLKVARANVQTARRAVTAEPSTRRDLRAAKSRVRTLKGES